MQVVAPARGPAPELRPRLWRVSYEKSGLGKRWARLKVRLSPRGKIDTIFYRSRAGWLSEGAEDARIEQCSGPFARSGGM